MTVSADNIAKSFILLPLASRRIAVAADSVIELRPPERVQKFPHRTPWICGVIVRRNRVVPVLDTDLLFGETGAAPNRFHLIVEWRQDNVRDWCAVPVQGECELLSAGQVPPIAPPTDAGESYVAGLLSAGHEEIEVIDLSELIRTLRATGESAS